MEETDYETVFDPAQIYYETDYETVSDTAQIYDETVSDDVKRSGSMEDIRNTEQIYYETDYETVSDDVKRSGSMEEIRNTEQIYYETDYETVSDPAQIYYETDYETVSDTAQIYDETVSDDVKRSGSMEEIRNTEQIYYETDYETDYETVSDPAQIYYETDYETVSDTAQIYDETVSDDVKRSGSMEEIRNTEQIYETVSDPAQIYYETDYETVSDTAQIYDDTVSDDVKRSVVDLINKMDSDKDGKVSLDEFATFMTEGGYVAMNNCSFFKNINKNKNGELDFEDVMTLCYLLVSRRPLCDGCRKFIGGTHSHFVDNYALLESIRHNGLPAQNKWSKPNQSTPSTSISAIVPTRDERKVAWENLLAALGMTANIAGIVAALGTCTIL